MEDTGSQLSPVAEHVRVPTPPVSGATAQADLEAGVVEIFSELADLFGNPRSFGAIYGVLFLAETPLSMEDIVSRLSISKGSASQGLRVLEDLGAIVRDRTDGQRVSQYTARLELKVLVGGFIRQRLVPRLDRGAQRLEELEALLPQLPSATLAGTQARLERLSKWHRRARAFLPVAQKLLQGS